MVQHWGQKKLRQIHENLLSNNYWKEELEDIRKHSFFTTVIAQKLKFSIKAFFTKCDHLL